MTLLFLAKTLQIFGSKSFSIRCITMHKNHAFTECQVFFSCHRLRLLQEVNVDVGSHFNSICDYEWLNQLITNECSTKPPLSDPVRVWTPSVTLFRPSIGSIEGRTTFISEQNVLKTDLYVIFCTIHPLLVNFL